MGIVYDPHTADICMRLEADSLSGIFELGLIGMSNILKEDICNKPLENGCVLFVEINASDYTNLLIDFLSEVLSNSYVENSVYCTLRILEFGEYHIKAEMQGAHVDAWDEEIKAVTYPEARVKTNEKGQWETSVIFDI